MSVPEGFADAYRAYAEGGWNGIGVDQAHGGQGLPEVVASAVQEMLHGANMALGLCPMLTAGAIEALIQHGDEAQCARYLAPLVEGRWTGTMNLTEPQAGSDLSRVRTRAEPTDEAGTYRLTGQKIFITWASMIAPRISCIWCWRACPTHPKATRAFRCFWCQVPCR